MNLGPAFDLMPAWAFVFLGVAVPMAWYAGTHREVLGVLQYVSGVAFILLLITSSIPRAAPVTVVSVFLFFVMLADVVTIVRYRKRHPPASGKSHRGRVQ